MHFSLDAITAINICLTLFNLACAINSSIQTKKQTKIMQRQLEIAQEPDFALTGRLDGIKNAIYHIGDVIKKNGTK